MDQKQKNVWVNVKLKEKACRDDVDIGEWILLSVVEKSGLITWRVAKWIKMRDEHGRLINKLAQGLNIDLNL